MIYLSLNTKGVIEMPDTILKTKILEKYKSIRYFCFINDIPYSTLIFYCNGKISINSINYKTLAKICDGLECEPTDIGYTKEYWYTVCSDRKLRVAEPPSFIEK